MAGIFHFVTALSLPAFAQAVSRTLRPGRVLPSTGEVLLLDTPTFALRRNGWLLILIDESGEHSLSLRQLGRQATLIARAAERVPEAVHDVDNRPLRERLEAWIGDSRLVVVQRWQTHGVRHECRNDDDPVECTLVARQYHTLVPGGPASPVLVELLPKRGYADETDDLARTLAQHLPWRALARDACELLGDLYLAAAATQCADLPPLRQTTAATAVASWLLEHQATLCAKVVPGAPPDAEQLHELRVAMRHSRSLLRAYRDLLGRDLERHIQGELRWLATATSRLRDIDVLHAALLEPAADYAALDAHERQRLLNFLARERARDAARLQRALESRRYRRLRQIWPLALATVINQAPPDAPSIAVSAAAAIRSALVRLRRDIIAVEANPSPSVVHELRKQCKRVRYLVEPCACLYPREQIARAQSGLKQLQTRLGQSCDRHAQWALFEGHLWRRAKGRAALRTALKSARLALGQRLADSDLSVVRGALAEFDAGRYLTTLGSLLEMPDL